MYLLEVLAHKSSAIEMMRDRITTDKQHTTMANFWAFINSIHSWKVWLFLWTTENQGANFDTKISSSVKWYHQRACICEHWNLRNKIGTLYNEYYKAFIWNSVEIENSFTFLLYYHNVHGPESPSCTWGLILISIAY